MVRSDLGRMEMPQDLSSDRAEDPSTSISKTLDRILRAAAGRMTCAGCSTPIERADDSSKTLCLRNGNSRKDAFSRDGAIALYVDVAVGPFQYAALTRCHGCFWRKKAAAAAQIVKPIAIKSRERAGGIGLVLADCMCSVATTLDASMRYNGRWSICRLGSATLSSMRL